MPVARNYFTRSPHVVAVLAVASLLACTEGDRVTAPASSVRHSLIVDPGPCDNPDPNGCPKQPGDDGSGFPPDAPYEEDCNPGQCTLVLPTDAEFQAILDEANRLIDKYNDDLSSLGRQCYALGTAMRNGMGDIRMTDYEWSAPDANGNYSPVAGDSHTTEPEPGAGRVHIARGFNPLNPTRGMPAIVNTARHEFGHLGLGLPQQSGGFDPAGQLAAQCGP